MEERIYGVKFFCNATQKQYSVTLQRNEKTNNYEYCIFCITDNEVVNTEQKFDFSLINPNMYGRNVCYEIIGWFRDLYQ